MIFEVSTILKKPFRIRNNVSKNCPIYHNILEQLLFSNQTSATQQFEYTLKTPKKKLDRKLVQESRPRQLASKPY